MTRAAHDSFTSERWRAHVIQNPHSPDGLSIVTLAIQRISLDHQGRTLTEAVDDWSAGGACMPVRNGSERRGDKEVWEGSLRLRDPPGN